MITIQTFKRLTSKTFDKFSKFALIGNDIDGFVNVGIIEFENFENVKTQLPNVIKKLEFAGEWDVRLYQIPDQRMPFPHFRKYFAPPKGKLILDLSYMNMNEHSEIFITDGMMHIYSYSEVFIDEWNNVGEIKKGTVYENYTTVLLYHQNKKKADIDGNMEMEMELYFRLKNSSGLKELSNFSFD